MASTNMDTSTPQPLNDEATKSNPIRSNKPQPKKKKSNPAHQEGVFSPVVIAFKSILGEDTLNKVRAKAISLPSAVIANFVDTYTTPFGQATLNRLFAILDTNKDCIDWDLNGSRRNRLRVLSNDRIWIRMVLLTLRSLVWLLPRRYGRI